jgi:MFS transporter, MHS family, proline/betaine transporter
VGYILRSRIADLPLHRQTHHRDATPLRDVVCKYPRMVLASGALITLSTICTYVVQVYTPIYAVRSLHLPQSAGLAATMVGTVTTGALIPVTGLFVDRFGPRIFLRVGAALLIILTWPMFRYITVSPSLVSLLIYQIVFGVVIAVYQGPILAGIAAMLPSRALATGLGLSGNIAVSIFGGTAALVITWLIALTGSNLVPAFYIVVGGIVGMLGTLPLSRRAGLRVTIGCSDSPTRGEGGGVSRLEVEDAERRSASLSCPWNFT